MEELRTMLYQGGQRAIHLELISRHPHLFVEVSPRAQVSLGTSVENFLRCILDGIQSSVFLLEENRQAPITIENWSKVCIYSLFPWFRKVYTQDGLEPYRAAQVARFTESVLAVLYAVADRVGDLEDTCIWHLTNAVEVLLDAQHTGRAYLAPQ